MLEFDKFQQHFYDKFMSEGCLPKDTLYDNALYWLRINKHSKDIELVMGLYTSMVTTQQLPLTTALLFKLLPDIYKTQCLNDQKLPFRQEIQDTELGHLFEHILLVYLCEEKVALGCQKSVFSGTTSWDWHKEQRGMFHIRVRIKGEDQLLLQQALSKTMALFDVVLQPPHDILPNSALVPTLSFSSIGVEEAALG